MKIFFTALIPIFLSSCVTPSFFQVYKTESSEKIVKENNNLVYEDENCKVLYNLWQDGGNIGLKIYNKTDENIYLNLGESFFILNGVSHNYYKNRVFTNSSSSGTTSSRDSEATKSVSGTNQFNFLQTNTVSTNSSKGSISSSSYSVSFHEEKIVYIPSKTSKAISEYVINKAIFRDCDLLKYPASKRQVRSKNFSKDNSPFVFSNRISYSVGSNEKLIKFENEFYVTEISNFPESEMYESKIDEYCGQRSLVMTKHFKNISADKFYFKYTKVRDLWSH